MDKKKIQYLIIGIVFAVLVGNISLGLFLQNSANQPPSIQVTPTRVSQQVNFSYQGIDGKDALTILKERTSIEQNESGLVVLINGRKAEVSKREFWAFYVNGKMAEVGPAEYTTKTGDTIEWKIETY